MVRVGLSLLLVVNLLACPLRCISSEIAVGQEPPPSSCSCCHHQSKTPASDVPDDCPEQECQCQNCICEGATLQDRPQMPGDTGLTLCFSDRAVMAVTHLAGIKISLADRQDRFLCGRDVRIAHQSWLI